MPTRIASQNASSAEDLRCVFESAVDEIRQDQEIQRHLPIVQRNLPNKSLNCQRPQKRALSDAARALAQLWKVSMLHVR